MRWNGSGRLAFGIFTVLGAAPPASGIYALFVREECVYIGEAENIQLCLLRHLNGPDACVLRYGVTSFAYECIPPEARAARLQALVAELSPLCQDNSASLPFGGHP